MTEPKFKVGDKVKCISKSTSVMKYGEVSTVSDVGDWYVYVHGQKQSSGNGIGPNVLELVKDTPTFKVGDKVRCFRYETETPGRVGHVGHVVRVTSDYVHVDGNYETPDGVHPFRRSELELVEEPTVVFKTGDRVELAGVQGRVVYTNIKGTYADILWDDGKEFDCFNLASRIGKQIKKLSPEPLFITGAWYKHPNNSALYYLSPKGWQFLSAYSDGLYVGEAIVNSEALAKMTEVDSPL